MSFPNKKGAQIFNKKEAPFFTNEKGVNKKGAQFSNKKEALFPSRK
jgi:hypothetical protein